MSADSLTYAIGEQHKLMYIVLISIEEIHIITAIVWMGLA